MDRKRVLFVALPTRARWSPSSPWSWPRRSALTTRHRPRSCRRRPPRPPTTKPDPTVPVGVPTAPLTGLALENPLVGFRPALAVKIDNVDTGSDHARPQAGIAAADVVFEEIVEGGITRLVAVIQSELPGRVGPIRSARTTDPAMLRPARPSAARVVGRQRRRRCRRARQLAHRRRLRRPPAGATRGSQPPGAAQPLRRCRRALTGPRRPTRSRRTASSPTATPARSCRRSPARCAACASTSGASRPSRSPTSTTGRTTAGAAARTAPPTRTRTVR